MDRVEECISFLLSKAAQEVARRARAKLSPHGITPTQYAVLKVLWERNGQTAAEVGARLSIDSATITGVIDRLEAGAHLTRQADAGDRRIHRLLLTEQGRALHKPLDEEMDRLNAEVRQVLGAKASTLWGALRKLGTTRD